jgi:ATP-dependent DNA helicase RecG
MTGDTLNLGAGESETAVSRGPRAALEVVARDVCGMLNQRGGVVFWGVTEDGKVAGLREAHSRARELNEHIAEHFRPRPLVSVSVRTNDDRELIVVDVPLGADKPYSVDRQIWIRVGSHTLRATADDSVELVERSAARLERWERETMPGFSIPDCDGSEIAQTRAELVKTGRFGAAVPDQDEDLLRYLYLQSGGQLTNACVTLFAREPRAWSPNLSLRITSHTADHKDSVDVDTVLSGPAVSIVKEGIAIIQRQTGFTARRDRTKLERQDRPAYALFALREGLTNAIVHRDYAALGDVRVEIHPEWLVVQNPGSLPQGWTESDLKKPHTSQPINPDIARVFFLRGMMEQLGLGAQRLIEECKALGAPSPTWKVEKGSLSLKMFRAPAATALSDRPARFVAKTKPGTEFKLHDYARSVDVSERQARRDLVELESLGLIERRGRGPATSYRMRAG